MKSLQTLFILCVAMAVAGSACKKQTTAPPNDGTGTQRQVQFSLYTDKDLSADNNFITFKLSIQNSSSTTLWDSTLAPMRIKDIPNLANKLEFVKWVPNNDPSLLKVGFYYTIENVGNSWHLDSFNAGETLKKIEFNFQ
jgi:hypothetical protein